MHTDIFDLTIIGAGPGGYVAAIRAAQLGLKTALVEKNSYLGGTCLNVGCIPTKTLLHSSEWYYSVKTKGTDHGIDSSTLTIDLPTLMKRKEQVIQRLRGGIKQLIAKRGIEVFTGIGKIKGVGKVEVEGRTLTTKSIVIATGSIPLELPFLPFDGETVVSSEEALSFSKIPKHLGIVGAGAIGLELGCFWSRLGSRVTIVELLPQIAPSFDVDMAKVAERLLEEQGITFSLGTEVTGFHTGESTYLTTRKEGRENTVEADKILVAVGRRPQIAGFEELGISLEKGFIKTGKSFETSISGIYAIGDVISSGPMLAHKAEEEGVAVAEHLAGKAGHVNYEAIPNVIYTSPEMASVGLTEESCKKQKIEINVGKFPVAANGRAIASGTPEGLVKVVAHAKTDKLLGVQIVGAHASELIAVATTHLEYGGSSEDMARTVFAHPTLSESLKEAALGVEKRAIHAF